MKQTIPVVGMACSACSANVERKLNELKGIKSASVNLASRSAVVEYAPEVITPEEMKREINQLGYDLIIEKDRSAEEIEKREYTLLRRKTLLSWAFAIAVMSLSMGWTDLDSKDFNNQISLIIAMANIAYCGWGFYKSAWRQIKHGNANMDTLVTLSTTVSFAFSAFNTFEGEATWGVRGLEWHTYFDASVMIITFVLTGRLIEEKAKDGTASSIRELMGMVPKTAHVVTKEEIMDEAGNKTERSETRDVPLSTIEKGDIVEVRSGEKVPVDGDVTWANSFMKEDASYVDESMISGEPTPSEKKKGAKALAGTMVCQGKFRMKARQVGEETAIAHIIETVREAQGSKAPVQRMVDKVARVFVPVVCGLAAVTFVAWWVAGGNKHLPQAIMSAVAVLVVACPCAMGLATPTALMVGIGKAAKKQILIKDASALEQLRKTDAIVTDKTGTLTIANQQVDFTQAEGLALEERERLKPHARDAMEMLKKQGIEVHMMSGDKEEAVKYWAGQAGIQHYRSKVMPQDKENMVKELQAKGKHVAMIGDGINDTQALAVADVSIAMGKGTDVAMDVAQVTLMGDDLRRIPEAVELSRKTVKKIRENLFWAFIYNVISIPLAGGILHVWGIEFQITPMWASALMAMSSVSVVLNSLRLKLGK